MNTQPLKLSAILLFSTLCLVTYNTTLGNTKPSGCCLPIKHNTKLWTALVYGGHVTSSDKLWWDVEFHNRFKFKESFFDEHITRTAFYYKLSKDFQLWLGSDFVLTLTEKGRRARWLQSIWPGMIWYPVRGKNFWLRFRTRLEFRNRFCERSPGYRLRHMATLKFPKAFSPRVSPVISNELFFNLSHPDWVGPEIFDQNRFYAGVDIQTDENHTWHLSYANQSIFSADETTMNHILYVAFKVKF